MNRPKIAWYGDDFTGATDTLLNAAAAGLRALLFTRVPSVEQLGRAGTLDAIGIAGAARSMSRAQIARELEPVGRFFAALEVPVLHYKVCSTFDSAPEVGNIAAAVHALRPHVASRFVPIVGGQPNIG
ncbi:MAG TPA: four-carbon acid sugar kinase family protein, partial [Burkholderiales bacterium]|nr:four-carbon acid sugar kinase family protein [Burkholderiales bacterium]